MRKTLTCIISLILSLITAISFSACKKDNSESNGGENSIGGAVTFVNLDINPEIELTVDENNKVVTVYGVNDDGKILLVEESLEGLTLDAAVEKITALAIELGYLTEDNKVVNTSVSSSNSEKVSEILNGINAKITAKAKDLGLTVKTDGQGAFSLVRKLEAFKAENADNQLIQALTVDEFKLALSASETGEVTLDVAVTLDDKELIELISRERAKVKEIATDAYNKAKAQASLIYDKVVNELVDGVYASFYLENLMKYPTTYWYGHSYQVYRTMERCFNGLAEVLTYAERSREYPLDEQTVVEVLDALGLDKSEIDKLKNADGKITLASIESYADTVIKNAAETVDLTALKLELTQVLNQIDQKLLLDVKAEIQKYQPQIEQIVLTVNGAITSLKAATALIPETLKTELDEFIADVESVINAINEDIKNGEINSAKLKEYAKTAGEKADSVFAKIENTLTEEEKAEIAKRVKAVEESLNSAKKDMEDALTRAEEEVKGKLKDLKDKRRPKK